MSLPILTLLLAAHAGGSPTRNSIPDSVRQRAFAGMPHGSMNETLPGEIMVKLRPAAAEALMAQRAGKLSGALSPLTASAVVPGGALRSRIGESGWTLWQVPAGTNVRTLALALRRNPNVLASEPVNRVYPLLVEPNDTDWDAEETSDEFLLYFGDDEPTPFRRLWHMDDVAALAGWSAWPGKYYTAANKPADPPLIAVIDTGVAMDHPDFVNAGGTSTDSAYGGQLDKSLSARFELGEQVDGSTDDDNGHGSHVAGLALAAANNDGFVADDGVKHGVAGTGYACRGMVLRVFDDQGTGTDADAAAAIYYAADHGADVINLSLGTTNFSQLFQDAVTYAFQKGSLVVAAGNENGSGGGDLGPIYPAACSGALAVEANGPDGVPATATYSGYGTYVDIAAPGGDLVQTDDQYTIQFVFSTATQNPDADLPNNPNLYPPYTLDYTYLAGTSMATPIVAGAAGMYYGKNGLDQKTGWANLKTYRALEQSAYGVMGAPRGSWEPYQGYGCLDMESLLTGVTTRNASVGAIEGIVYYNGTAFQNATVKAKKLGATVTYSTTTRSDGGYRFEQLPPGVYTVTTAPFGAAKSKSATVVSGSDQTAVDMWCGTYSGDDTPPTVARFEFPSYTPTAFTLRHWAYDTETSIDRMSVRIGTTPGATNVLADTEVFPENPLVTMTGLNIPTFSTFQARYTNGGNLTTTVTQATIPVAGDAEVRNGKASALNFGSATHMTLYGGATLSSHAYVKLDTSTVSGSVSKATLRVALPAQGSRAAAMVIAASPTASSWSQSTITWNNAPPLGDGVIASKSVSSSPTTVKWYDLDITDYVNSERAAGRPVMSLALYPNSKASGLFIGSSESGGTAPQLVLTATS